MPSAAPFQALRRSVAFLLDIDGTLVFTDHLYFRVFQALLTPYGYCVDQAFYEKNVLGKVDHDVFSKLMPEGTTEDELQSMSKRKDDCFCELYHEVVEKHGPPMLDGLQQALSTAQQMGVRAIAVTNAQRGAAEASVASLKAAIPAASIIEGLVIGAECTRAKPHPDPYVEGMRQLGVQPSDCIVFEDSRSGIQAGLAAEVMAVVGMRTSLDEDTLRELGCAASLPDWTGLTPEFLHKMVEEPRRSPEAS